MIENQEMWFRGLLHTSTDAIIAIDKSTNIYFMNIVAQKLLGTEESEAKGKPLQRILKIKTFDNSEIPLLQDNNYIELNKFEAEVYNRINKLYVQVSCSMTSVRDSDGNYSGKILIIKDIGEIKSLFSKIDYQTSHDSLTGLFNRKRLIEYSEKLINLSKTNSSTHGLLSISLDKFKIINDTCGHTAGDELLRKITKLINETISKNKYKIGRIGADEFGVLFKNTNITEVTQFTKTIKRKISKQDFIWGKKEHAITCSYGIVIIDKNSRDHYEIFAAVDDACAISKENGGGKIEIYDNVHLKYNKRRDEMLWIHKLKEAIKNQQFKLYYQEIESVQKTNIKKLEILVRLKDSDGNIVSPINFIPPAELYGIMPEIDKIIIEQSIASCKKIIDNKEIKSKYIFSVNISGTSLLDKSLPGFILTIFQKYKVPPNLFCFEITETATIKNMDIARSFINNLKRIGCTFSLDDFGSGFSNFTYLRTMDVDYLKIDGSFIKDMLDEPINKAMVESINNIGHIMKMKTVAEYVESEELKAALIEIGVDYLQGYAICKPTPIEELLK
ncbi:MAG: EAL domain-containing protein [Spirochaetaceae bacterium]